MSQEKVLTSTDGQKLKVTLRTLNGAQDHAKFVKLEKAIWGEDFEECLPPSALMINEKVGGIVAGAFDENDAILAMIYGLTGPVDGKLLHWSHMMGVHPDYRQYKLGKAMKIFQRDFLLKLGGVDDVQWTYDPLESKNAHLNLNHLGALPAEYLLDVYGPGTGLHEGIGTDRFVVSWRILDERVGQVLAEPLRDLPESFAQAPTVNTQDGVPNEGTPTLPEASLVRIEVPRDIQTVKLTPGMGKKWRDCTRHAFQHYMGLGYRVVRFYSCSESGRSFYILLAPWEV